MLVFGWFTGSWLISFPSALDTFFAEQLPASRKGTRWDQILQVLVTQRLLAPGSEWHLHRDWFERTALADRLHDCAAFIPPSLQQCRRVDSHFLIRIRSNIKVKVLRRFKDGSRLVRVPVRQKGQPRQINEWLELREIRVRVGRKDFRTQELRLWTSLLDPRRAPADELAVL